MTLYYDDMSVGDEHITARKTIRAEEVSRFASSIGDWRPRYIDETRPNHAPHELYLYSLSFGLRIRTNLFNESGVAFLGCEWEFMQNVAVGDTIVVAVRIESKRPTRQPDRGIVVQRVDIRNQDGELLQSGTHTAMYRHRGDTP